MWEVDEMTGDGQMLGKPPESRQRHFPLSEPSAHTEPQCCKAGCPILLLFKVVPHTIYRCLFQERESTALPNTQKQTQGGCKIETKKYGPSKRIEQTPEKELNEMEIGNLSYAEFKTLVIRCSKNSFSVATK